MTESTPKKKSALFGKRVVVRGDMFPPTDSAKKVVDMFPRTDS